MDDDWDLHAVVRGCSANNAAATTASAAVVAADLRPRAWFPAFGAEQDSRFVSFPDPFEARLNAVEELQELCKPFFTKSQPPLSPQNISFSPPPLISLGALKDQTPPLAPPPPPPPPQLQKQRPKQFNVAPGTTAISTSAASTTHSSHQSSNRPKRRKNQLKKVCHIPAEGLSSDVWAWRKYGQKPIKGSPYPRGYYRCSSSKGCLARKQVERNKSDPGMFIVTYTAEHNHPVPTHRNSLAGSTRQKPLTPQTATAGSGSGSGDGDPAKAAASKPSCSSPGSLSNTTSPLTVKTDARVVEEDLGEDEEDEELGLSDMVMDDDFFTGLEELASPATGDCFPDHFASNFPLPWLASSAATAASGS
ncbi:WRKY transcription factor 22 [Malania oleifera]|uniref:WRKY transcription factor 22 n=1 Tax=Malania oleifera TaxID=397392 RepID=UPI0025ADB02B|nr:WRKY transcription factor 22 [Malania oleifera]